MARRVARSVVVAGLSGTSAQTTAVGAPGLSTQAGAEPVVLVASAAIARPEVLGQMRADHDHDQGGRQQGLNDGAVWPFDGDLGAAE